ncbi:MAG: heavy metal translocating P-type ATPase metal-binding domain-containing protein, partial [Cyclobacteriaceae bacterium]
MPARNMLQSKNPVESAQATELRNCFHCGQPCDDDAFHVDEKIFCCYGCKTVFEILDENDLCEYYNLESAPGVRLNFEHNDAYEYLDEDQIKETLILFEIDGVTRIRFYIPSIHCISCIWLLENLNRIEGGILKSEVNFAKKTVLIDFDANKIKLSKVAALLASTGYAPIISLEGDKGDSRRDALNNKLILKLAVAGFCFGNIMLLSFPEYFGIDQVDAGLKSLFSYLNVFLGLPVVLYSARDYFISAWKSFNQKQVNIDVPIALGIFVLFVRSATDILTQTGPGYMDSLAGLVFFLLIGRWFQDKTYESLAFDRDYKSYFPLAVYKKDNETWRPCVVKDLKKGDQIRIRNREITPADSILTSKQARIDYSF